MDHSSGGPPGPPAGPPAVGIVGLGYVGLPLALGFTSEGIDVVGLDSDARRVEQIRAGESYVEDVEPAELAAAVTAGRLKATTNYDEMTAA